jgi:hypothetical protein
MDDNSGSSVDDSELDKMIANIQGQPTTPPAIVGQGTPLSTSDGSAAATGQDDATGYVAPPAPAPVSPPMNSAFVPDDGETPQNPTYAPEPVAAAPVTPIQTPAPAAISSELDSIKRDALTELRPLVDKLTLPPEEKFNTILLIIRSTDDPSLLSAAHEAARSIPDENLRAQALLDVIKEVDFFGQPR